MFKPAIPNMKRQHEPVGELDPPPTQNIQPLPHGTVNLIPSDPKLFYKFATNPQH